MRSATLDAWEWSERGLQSPPAERRPAVIEWTGSQMLIWGGSLEGYEGPSPLYLFDGFRYQPLTDAWSPIPSGGAPKSLYGQSSVWAGTELIVWGGYRSPTSNLRSGARYSPALDKWLPTSLTGAPEARYWHVAVWTGTEKIVWGGFNEDELRTGGRYNPASDTWRAMSTIGAPTGRVYASVVWTGKEMIVWGGYYLDVHNYEVTIRFPADLGRYDPATDTWVSGVVPGAPALRAQAPAIWTGHEMIVWGGWNGSHFQERMLNTGGRYDPEGNSWTAMSAVDAPVAKVDHAALWTGEELIVWGGRPDLSGGRYRPATDTWTVSNTNQAPVGGRYAVWTGEGMLAYSGKLHSYSEPGSYAWDGIPDAWQRLYFGVDNPLGLPSVDADGDLQNNLHEHYTGTDPTNASSRLEFQWERHPSIAGSMVVSFAPQTAGRIYELQGRTDVDAGDFDPAGIIFSNVTSPGGAFEVTNVVQATRFLRLRIDIP